jgi:hypothetical protein
LGNGPGHGLVLGWRNDGSLGGNAGGAESVDLGGVPSAAGQLPVRCSRTLRPCRCLAPPGQGQGPAGSGAPDCARPQRAALPPFPAMRKRCASIVAWTSRCGLHTRFDTLQKFFATWAGRSTLRHIVEKLWNFSADTMRLLRWTLPARCAAMRFSKERAARFRRRSCFALAGGWASLCPGGRRGRRG